MELQEGLELLSKLIEKSEERKLDWQSTADENTFIATTKGNTFKVVEYVIDNWGNETTGVSLQIIDDKGKAIWKIDTSQLQPHARQELNKLFSIAQTIGDKVEERLSQALKSLDSL